MRRTVFFGIGGFLLGVISLVAFRVAFAAPEPPVHYHANFAIFIEGARVDLTDDRYMQDVAACPGGAGLVPPTSRVHLHDNNQDVVHVHHGGATWGHLLANLQFVLGDGVLVTRDGEVFLEGEGRTLKFILNGRPELSVYNQLIRPGDRLLISYGPESEQAALASQFPVVATNAAEYDQLTDPAGCGAAEEPVLRSRLWHAFAG